MTALRKHTQQEQVVDTYQGLITIIQTSLAD